MVTKDKLKKYARDLEFDMEESEYGTLESEFQVLLKQVDLISEIPGISEYDPMDFPFPLEDAFLREDEESMSLDKKRAFSNAKDVQDGCVKTPRVVA